MVTRSSFFMLLRATAAWRALDLPTRERHWEALQAAVFHHHPGLQVRRFDTAAFGGRCTDVLLWQAEDVAEYCLAVESFTEDVPGAPLAPRWFELVEVISAVEDAGRIEAPAWAV